MGEVKPFRRSNSPVGKDEESPHNADDLIANTLAKVSRGDEAAASDLYDQLGGLIYGVALKVLRNPAQAEEVAQEVFVEIWRLAPRYERSKGSPKSWAARIAHNRAVDRVRSENAAREREKRDFIEAPPEVDAVSEAIEDRVQVKRVTKALETLTEVQRSAIELAYFKGHTYREVAVVLDIAEGTAKTRIRDGLIRLRDHLGVSI